MAADAINDSFFFLLLVTPPHEPGRHSTIFLEVCTPVKHQHDKTKITCTLKTKPENS